jgi:hypothetical protein
LSSSSFHDNPGKKIVRETWNTPFLRYIHDKYKVKYRYMGFPGTDLIDVRLWKDMIEEVVAFELPSPREGEREWIRTLRQNLRKFGINGMAYLGSFEEVVILGVDYEGQPYKQDKLITLYNLDFCDEIGSAVATRELGRKRWRYEAIRLILQDQKRCYRSIGTGEPCYFIILLTVRNQIEANKIRGFLSNNLLSETSSYCLSCESVKPIPASGQLIGTYTWPLKAFLYNTLIGDFIGSNICAVFFPIIKYIGTPTKVGSRQFIKSPMLHWMLLCKFGLIEAPSPKFYPAQYLDSVNSLHADESGVSIQIEPGEIHNASQDLSPINWFSQFESAFISDGKLI